MAALADVVLQSQVVVEQPFEPKLVVEVIDDHVTDRSFRRGTKFLRWQPERAPCQCTLIRSARMLTCGKRTTINNVRAHVSDPLRLVAEFRNHSDD